MEETVVEIPEEFERLFDSDWREAAIWGGRSSLKSHTVARYLLIRARMAKTRILCAREFQNSIAESSHQLLTDLINLYELTDFKVTDKTIINTITGSEFIFKGLHHNEQSIKSIEGVAIAWVEEAQTITQNSIEILTPTIREDGSQIIWTYNRLLEEDPVHKRLVIEGRPNTLKINVNYDIAIKYGWMSQVLIDEMESDKANRPSLYKVKWLGEPASVEGRIFRDWLMIEKLPHEARRVGRGLDFGYSCLFGGTLVETLNGEVRIDEIKEGDFVLTRKGYRRVVKTLDRGIKEVYEIDFGHLKRIIATGDHKFLTADGWKEVVDFQDNETVCVLNKSLKDKFIKDTQRENTPTIFTIKGQGKLRNIKYYIEKFTRNTTEKYQRNFIYTTKTVTHSITRLKTSLQSLIQTTQKFITQKIWEKYLEKKWTGFAQYFPLIKQTGRKGGSKVWKPQEKELKTVLSAGRIYNQQTYTKNSVGRYAGKRLIHGFLQKSTLVRNVKRPLSHQHISTENHALKSVPISLQKLTQRERVYDLSIEGEHEFFANGILVHNCDPVAVVDIFEYNGGYILDEVIYRKGMSNSELATALREGDILTVADSAEPKSIDELKSYGITVVPAEKGKDSILHGIQLIQGLRISVTAHSQNLWREYNSYMWDRDRDGKWLTRPENGADHGIDACRYFLQRHLKKDANDTKEFYDTLALKAKMRVKRATPRAGLR